jgi:hypothetical protein
MSIFVALPWLAALTLLVALRIPWRLFVLLSFFVPLVADIVLTLSLVENWHAIFSLKFIYGVLGIYPAAVISFEYCAPILGSVAWRVLRVVLPRMRREQPRLATLGVLTGAFAGALLMLLLVPYSHGGYLLEWGAVGTSAGAVTGWPVAEFSEAGPIDDLHSRARI